jgi:glycosyltransferase involved in cell wall biosynthesis
LLPSLAYEILELCYNVPAFYRLLIAYRKFRPDLIYERYNLFMIAGICLSKLFRTPLFLEINAPLARERSAFGRLALRRFGAWIERQTWRNADLVLPVSGVLSQIVAGAGVPQPRLFIIPNGADEEYFQLVNGQEAKATLGLREKIVLGFTGFVREWHGLEDVIDLLSHPQSPADLHFVLVGDGPALDGLKCRAERLGVSSKVTFAGLVTRARLPTYLAAFDVALQPRAVEYASPLKLLEYMAAGKAIIAPNQPNIREIVDNKKNALLFDPKSEEMFREVVLTLASNIALRENLGRAARQSALDRGYTWLENARRISRLYEQKFTA